MQKALLTVDEAAEILSLSPRTLSRLVRQGEIPIVRVGRLVRVRTADIHAWVERQAGSWGEAPSHGKPIGESRATSETAGPPGSGG
jgi:excisionase family DNA binding protein